MGNLPYVQGCAKVCDFLLIQEHWLFSCLKDSLCSLFPNFNNKTTSTDDDNPIAQYCLPRGWGGVSILWKKNLNHLIRHVDVHSNRTTAIIFNTSNPTLLINTYLPSGNSPAKKTEYISEISQLKALIERYRNYDIILAGDFNMDLNKEAYFNDPRRIALFELANDCSLTQIIPNKIPTMTAHNGRDSSCIDMVFVSNVDMCTKPGVEEKVPWITTCHTPISFSLVPPKHHPPPGLLNLLLP